MFRKYFLKPNFIDLADRRSLKLRRSVSYLDKYLSTLKIQN